eukprot:TRINITY_DN38798_c0_g1_i1.p2 TRINITY_DN38798_c0_g1~~TRINITY_DN38798_c0_g1_i1.p2  ORF type:complete len:143 (+),score=6.01 TRINITY_DN38798_c0_g1_i1:137-565(+)
MKDLFTGDLMTSVLSNLTQRTPLPPLIMRTIISTWHVHTDTRRYLVNTIADQLLARRIYDDTKGIIWTGFCWFMAQAIDTPPIGDCCEVLLKLPAEPLNVLLSHTNMVDRDGKSKLRDYVGRLSNRTIESRVLQVIDATNTS